MRSRGPRDIVLSLGQLSFLPHFLERYHLAPALLRRVGRLRSRRCRGRFHEAADFLRRAPLHIVGDVRIGVQCEPCAEVAQHTGQGFHIHAAGKGMGGEGVSKSWNSIFDFYCTRVLLVRQGRVGPARLVEGSWRS